MLVTFPGILKAEDIGPRACFRSRGWFWYDFESHFTNKLSFMEKIFTMTRQEQIMAIHFHFLSYMCLSEPAPRHLREGETVEGPVTCRIILFNEIYMDLYR